MKLNILSKSLLAAGMLAMVACSDEAPIQVGDHSSDLGSEGSGYFMTVNVQLPSIGGRSETTEDGWGQSSDKTEIGFEYENDVNDILIVLANAEDNGFITAGSVAGAKLNPVPSQNTYRPIAKLDKTSLSEFYQNNSNRTINVFVFCNPTKSFAEYVNTLGIGDSEWVNATCTVTEGNGQSPTNVGVWGQNGFLMSNIQICARQLPPDIDSWKKYTTEETAFNLSGINSPGGDDEVNNSSSNGRGSIRVERSVARFDFRDGSQLGDNTYNVIYTLDADNKQTPLFNVQLNRMMLTNEAKEFYYLPRVSGNGQLLNSILCGSETPTNYIVGPYAAIPNASFNGNFDTYFNYPFFNSNNKVDFTQWNTTYLNDVIGKTADNLSDDQLSDEYYVWRYVTENVIPSDNDNQTMGRTTMVVFKGRLIPTTAAFESTDASTKAIAEAIGDGTKDSGSLTGNPTKDPVIYYFNNLAYFNWESIKKAAIESALQFDSDHVPTFETENEDGTGKKSLTNVRRSSSLYLAVFGDGCMGEITWGGTTYYDDPEGMSIDTKSTDYLYNQYVATNDDEARTAFKAAVTGLDITIYESSNDPTDGPGYYFYYYYKNRHNDNLDNGSMGAMEFATVRNNIYKLAVTNINSLGHPRIPENDPDEPTPDTPDESEDLYITVSCRVIPWVVRINNIVF